MKRASYALAGLFAAASACTASGAVDELTWPNEQPDSEAPPADAGSGASDAPDVDLDAARPLVCGDGGFCETRLPKSELGLPLSLRSVWVAGDRDVWSVGLEGMILHYDGSNWTTEFEANHELYSIWATPTSVWAGGEGGLLLRRDGAGTWSRIDTGHVAPIRSIYGSNDGDVWFTREDASLDHWDGARLRNRPFDVPDLELTTVFGREGFGMYAAGHVPGARPVTGVIEDRPYVFTLSPESISVFSTPLAEQRGFAPISGAVTNSPDPARRIFLVGRQELTSVFGTSYNGKYCLFGSDGPVTIRDLRSNLSVIVFTFAMDEQRVTDRRAPLLAYEEDDVWLVWGLGALATWNGSTRASLKSTSMGRTFHPGAVFGAHHDSTSTWLVGDGFALKGIKP